MSEIHPPLPVKLVAGILTPDPALLPGIEEKLTALFGTVDARSELFPFDWTDYYREEMGGPLHRGFFGFTELICPSTIAGIKIKTNALEKIFAGERAGPPRPVNIDPGYIEQSKLVLASAKNFYHRILIAEGIYAEATLYFSEGQWRAFPWTFPDYASGRYHSFFISLRSRYREQLSEAGYRIRIPRLPGRRKKE
ncbi:MAG TPA: DUF4416 family protein [Acidobacteriota bacterium]|nr:DUF4416 family protein [Acidobacteriota bacterium]